MELDVIHQRIRVIRGQRVMIDSDLAVLYDVPTGRLVEAVKRNVERFPEDFMFQLSIEEHAGLLSQSAIAKGRGGRRTPPYAFSEQGVAMLSSVLRSRRAVAVNIEIVRAFVQLRCALEGQGELAHRLGRLEQSVARGEALRAVRDRDVDAQIAQIIEVIRQLMIPASVKRRPLGFIVEDASDGSTTG